MRNSGSVDPDAAVWIAIVELARGADDSIDADLHNAVVRLLEQLLIAYSDERDADGVNQEP